MKKLTSIVVCVFFSLVLMAQEKEIQQEKELIREVIQTSYVDGFYNNLDQEAINKGIHPGLDFLGMIEDGTIWKAPFYNMYEYAKRAKEAGSPYSFGVEPTSVKFKFIDIEGNVAMVKLEFFNGPDLEYIDYLSLIKFEKEGWMIVGKTYYKIPKELKE